MTDKESSSRGFSFSREDKLVHKNEFDQVFINPKKVYHEGLLFLFAKNNIGFPRLGLAIPKRILPKASKRNYIKRCVRETFRQKKQAFHVQGIDIVVLPNKSIQGVMSENWFTLCEQGWARVIRVLSTSVAS